MERKREIWRVSEREVKRENNRGYERGKSSEREREVKRGKRERDLERGKKRGRDHLLILILVFLPFSRQFHQHFTLKFFVPNFGAKNHKAECN